MSVPDYSKRDKMERRPVGETLGGPEGSPKTNRTAAQGNKGVNMEMPFGKHQGEDIEDLPTGYIVWCLKNLDDLDDEIEQDMDYELKKRTDIQRWKWKTGDWRAKK